MTSLIVVAGATGNLGHRIATHLVKRVGRVRALVRATSSTEATDKLRALGVDVVAVEFSDAAAMKAACTGAACVVSALAGLRSVMIDAQSQLLDAAVAAGVPRFIPSDFAIDFTKFAAGNNRNLDVRRAFHEKLDKAPIAATSIFNGAFADMLTGQAPFILYARKRVLCWGSPDQQMDFTTVDDVAAFTAAAALDASTPRQLHIAGDRISARGLADVMTSLTRTPHRVFRPGGLGMFGVIIKVMRTLMPAQDDLYPPWQGMQYMHNMYEGRAGSVVLDNARYPDLTWTTTKDVIAAHLTRPA
jgi:nucleoside-diphosphate-sugar epimerase